MRQDICDWFDGHREQLTTCLQELVRIPSVRGEPRAGMPYGDACHRALKRFLGMGAGLGLLPAEYSGHCGSLLLPGTEGEEVALAVHLDVVPEGDGWLWPPYGGALVGDFVIGRGAQDNKGAAVAALFALACLRELGAPLRRSLRLVAGCNEESGMADLPHYLAAERAPSAALVVDCGFPVCHGERGSLTATLCCPFPVDGLLELTGGNAPNTVPDRATALLAAPAAPAPGGGVTAQWEDGRLRLTAQGVAAHCINAEQGCNAIALLLRYMAENGLVNARALETARALADILEDTKGHKLRIACADGASGELVVVGGMIAYGDGQLRLTVNSRYPVTADGERLALLLEEACGEYGFRLEELRLSPGVYTPANHPLVTTLTDVFNRCRDCDHRPYTMAGGTYARVLPRAVGYGITIPGFPKRPPDGAGDYHQANEAQSVPELVEGGKILVHALLALDGLEL